MLFKPAEFSGIASKACDNLVGFLNSNFCLSDDDRKDLLDELRSLDAPRFAHAFEVMDVSELIGEIIEWLEKRRKPPQKPWVKLSPDAESDLALQDCPNTRKLLDHLLAWFDRLVLAGGQKGQPEKVSLSLRGKWKLFKDYLGDDILPEKPWKIVIDEAGEGEKKFLGRFVSWLGTTKHEKTLHILLNTNAIEESSGDRGLVGTRLERVCLHELGHAVTELEWYLAQRRTITGPTWSRSDPWHECEAWAYALMLRMYIVTARSRVTRITKNGDYEWKGY